MCRRVLCLVGRVVGKELVWLMPCCHFRGRADPATLGCTSGVALGLAHRPRPRDFRPLPSLVAEAPLVGDWLVWGLEQWSAGCGPAQGFSCECLHGGVIFRSR